MKQLSIEEIEGLKRVGLVLQIWDYHESLANQRHVLRAPDLLTKETQTTGGKKKQETPGGTK